jgi:ABC-type dipeptide/oligopeptide/nickel transport system permease subunit
LILPNVAGAIIVNMTLNFPKTIRVETSLSFLGLGIQPPLTSLGNMVGFGRDYLLTASNPAGKLIRLGNSVDKVRKRSKGWLHPR